MRRHIIKQNFCNFHISAQNVTDDKIAECINSLNSYQRKSSVWFIHGPKITENMTNNIESVQVFFQVVEAQLNLIW